jgi:protein SCO1/2
MQGFARTFFTSVSLTLSLTAATYRVDGLVISVDHGAGIMTVAHRPIPSYMPAMSMPFRVKDPRELSGVLPGARVQFELRVNDGAAEARRIRVLKGGDVPPPPETVPIGTRLPDFTLTDQESRSVSLSSFRGKLVVVNFIYTRCPLPDVCPRLAASFAYLQRRFRDKLGGELVLLSITVDPQYDTPGVLRSYAERWKAEPGWRFLTGERAVVERAVRPFGVLYWPEDGAMTHSVLTAAIARDGTLAALVEGASARPDQLAELVSAQLEKSE